MLKTKKTAVGSESKKPVAKKAVLKPVATTKKTVTKPVAKKAVVKPVATAKKTVTKPVAKKAV